MSLRSIVLTSVSIGLALAVAFTAYCIAGPRLKERRYVARHGHAYRAYQAEVPYMWPSWLPGLPRAGRRAVR